MNWWFPATSTGVAVEGIAEALVPLPSWPCELSPAQRVHSMTSVCRRCKGSKLQAGPRA